ncbi:MAG: HAD-IIIC family phosphatase [Lysobacteraceae bacterium]
MPFAIQLKIELARLPSDDALARALVEAAAANPTARLQSRGRWWWDEGRTPRLTHVANGTPFSLQHPALRRRLPKDLGPPIEVLRWQGTGLVLRCAHALMDAAGLMYFAHELFRALRGEALLGSRLDLDDWSVVTTSPHRRPLPAFKAEWPSPAGSPSGVPEPGFIHEVRQVHGRVDSPTARIASVLARTGGGGCHLMIPVDLRLADERLRTTANLSNPLILTFDAGWDSNACWREILGALQRHEEFGVARGSAVLPWLPTRMMGRLLGAKQSQQMMRGRHFFTALCSNLARTRLASFAYGGVIPTRVGFLPFDTPGAGLNLLTLQNDDALELAASCPAASGGQGRLSRLLDEVCAELERGVSSHPLAPRQGNARIFIAASFVAEPIGRVLTYWMHLFGLSLEPAFAPYGQVFQALTDPASGFAANRDGVNVLLLRLEDWCRSPTRGDEKTLHLRLRTLADDFLVALEQVANKGEALVVVWLAPLSERARNDVLLSSILEPLLRFTQEALQRMQGIQLLEDQQVRHWYPVMQEEAPLAEAIGHVPFSRDRFATLATALARIIVSAVLPPFKVIVVDCDNTLWQGVCAEVGEQGVEVTAHHRVLQEFLLHQIDAGMLVCLCSRNQPADVEAVFERKGAMLLGLDHIIASRINWLPKSDNLHSLAAELRLGLDSFVFLDDSPVECAEVRAHCPGVQVVQIPTDASEIPMLLEHLWGFERPAQRRDVLARTKMYRLNSRRQAVRAESESFEAFLQSLELRVNFGPPTPDQWERVAELSRRTNQFNLAPLPRPAAYFQGLAPDAHCLVVDAEDRFGAYGLTGVVTWRTLDGVLYVNDWMLSCRVLGRGVEHRVLATLGEIASQGGCKDIVFCYVPSARNTPVLAFLESTCDRLPPREEATGVWFQISASRARTVSARETAAAPVLPQEMVDREASDSTPLPVGVLDLIANTLRNTAQIRAAAGDLNLGPLAVAHDEDALAGLLAMARSIAGAELEGVSPDESLIDLGMDSLQIVTLLDEAARLHGLEPDDADFNGGLGDFLARPTLRELASMLSRVPKRPST